MRSAAAGPDLAQRPLTKSIFFSPGGATLSGKEIVTAHLMKGLEARGFHTHALVSGWNDSRFPAHLTANALSHTLLELGVIHLRRPDWTFHTLRTMPGALRTLRGLAQDRHPRFYVHTTGKNILPIAACLPRNVLHILHVHDIMDFKSTKRHLNLFSGIICVSNFIASQFNNLQRDDVFVVHNGVSQQDEVAQGAAPPSSDCVFGIVGQIIERKQHDLLFDAAEQLLANGESRFRIEIYGDDTSSFAAMLKQRLSHCPELQAKVRWGGFRPASDIYRQISVLVAAGADEPFGTTVLEAGAHGVPVVAVRSGGYPEILDHERNALLFERGNTADLAACMAAMIAEFDQRQRLALALQTDVRQSLSIERYAEAFEAALRAIDARYTQR